MAIINLKRYYYPLITKDTYMEVPDDVAQAFAETEREGRREDHRKWYYGTLSLDQSVGLENHAMFFGLSPEELMVKDENNAAYEVLIKHLYEAVGQLTEIQRRRLFARYIEGKKVREIAEAEGVAGSVVSESVASAIRKLQRIFKKNKWTRIYKEDTQT